MAKSQAVQTLTCLMAAVAGLALGLCGAESVFGGLRQKPVEPALLFSVEVRDGAGALLASPLLVGEEGVPLHLNLSQAFGPHSESPALSMSLDLDPQSAGGENLCLGYKLSIDDGVQHQGKVALSIGERSSVRLSGGGESLSLELTVARAGSPEFEKMLRKRRRSLT